VLKNFPNILLDDFIDNNNINNYLVCENPKVARIWNIFDATDLTLISNISKKNRGNFVFRIYDLDLLDTLAKYSLENTPVILSHLIDLKNKKPEHKAGLAIEVANKQDLKDLAHLSVDLLIGKSYEAPGPSKESSALILFQLLKTQSKFPFYIQAYTNFALFQSYLSLGVSGFVIPANQFAKGSKSKSVRFQLGFANMIRLDMTGGMPEAVSVRKDQQSNPNNFLKDSYAKNLWCLDAEDLWSYENQKNILLYLQLIELFDNEIKIPACFYEGSLSCKDMPWRLPIFQGAMANVTSSPEFAELVANRGALPCLALAGLSVEQSSKIMRETANKNIHFAVGIVALSLLAEDLEKLVELFAETKPQYVIISAPQMDHINRLLKTDFPLIVHAPNQAMLKVLYDMGVRNFIIEGEEAGGHTSNIGSLSAWQGVLEHIIAANIQEKVHIIFAGGIKNKLSAELISAMLFYYGLHNSLRVSLQMGTAYLCTKEIITLTQLPQSYQDTIINNYDTIITGESVHRNVRQIVTEKSHLYLEKEWKIFSDNLELDEKKRSYEAIYSGGLKLAINSQHFEPMGSYMAGSICALLDQQITVDELHQQVLQEKPLENIKVFEPIAIVGVGTIIPGANNIKEHFINILLKRCFIAEVPGDTWDKSLFFDPEGNDDESIISSLGAFHNRQDSDLSNFKIPPTVSENMSQLQLVALRCAYQALDDAGYFQKPFPKDKVGVVIGAIDDDNQEPEGKIYWKIIRDRLEKLSKWPELYEKNIGVLFKEYEDEFTQNEITMDAVLGGQANLAASRIASTFDFHGLSNAVDAACSSSLAAISQAVRLLQERRCDVMLSGGIDTGVDQGVYIAFSRVQALSDTGSFPFDERADGFVVGAGGTIFVLKRYEDALKHGDQIYALIRGWGAANDGKGKGITAPDYEGQIQCLKNAYLSASIDPSSVDFVECHATGTPVGDAEERKTVTHFFGKERLSKQLPPLPVAGSKAITGHVRVGAGAVGLMSSIFAINTRCIPPQVNFENAPQGVNYESLGLQVFKKPKNLNKQHIITGTSSFGFGGINYHMVLSSSPKNQRSPLIDVDIANYPNLAELKNDIAFVFPGQGSQFVGMLSDFGDQDFSKAYLKQADDIFEELHGELITPLLLIKDYESNDARFQAEEKLKQTEYSQPAIFLCSAIQLQYLKANTNISPALVFGHSLGEYSALFASGIFSFEDAFRLTCYRGLLMAKENNSDNQEAMLAVNIDGDKAQALLSQIKEYACCANYNSYQQTVIAGSTAAIKALTIIANSKNISAVEINVSRAFHSALVSDCVEPMKKYLQNAEYHKTNIPVLACISRRVYPYHSSFETTMSEQDKALCIEYLSQQIDHSVDFISQVNAAYEAGIRRFIELGPSASLSKLIDQILKNKPFQTEAAQSKNINTLDNINNLTTLLTKPVLINRTELPYVRREKNFSKKKKPIQNTIDLNNEEKIYLAVSEVSGYKIEDISIDAEFEKDLGIDTLKIFEILSRLRGDVLPQEISNFRELTSIQKILKVSDSVKKISVEKQLLESKISYYKHKVIAIGELSFDKNKKLVKNYCFNGEYFENNTNIDTAIIAKKLCPELSELREILLPELLKEISCLVSKPLASIKSIVIVSYCDADIFYDASFFAIEAFIRSIQVDIPEFNFSYLHIDSETLAEETILTSLSQLDLSSQFAHRIGADKKISRGHLIESDGLFGDPIQLETLLSVSDVVLITGGARGIAAELAKGLIHKTKSHYIVIGRQEKIEDWMLEIPEGRVSYLACDLSDKHAIQKLELHKKNITLIIHAAGIEISKHILKFDEQEFQSILATKTQLLETLFVQLDTQKLKGVVQFSSIASYFASNGQAIYAAANAILNGTLPRGIPSLSIAWPAWSEIGMASRGVIKDILEASGVGFISPHQGKFTFESLLAGFLQFPPLGSTRILVNAESSQQQALNQRILASHISPLSLYEFSDSDRKISIDINFNDQQLLLLNDHVFAGKVYVPGSVMLRTFIAEFLKDKNVVNSNHLIGLSDINFLTPIIIDGNKITLNCSRFNNKFIAELKEGKTYRPIIELNLDSNLTETFFNQENIIKEGRPLSDCFIFKNKEINIMSYDTFVFGDNFRVLKSSYYNGNIIVGEVWLDKFSSENNLLNDTNRLGLLIEASFQLCAEWRKINFHTHFDFMPKHLEHISIHNQRCQLAKKATIFSQLITINKSIVCNVNIVNENGELILAIKKMENMQSSFKNYFPVYPLHTYSPFKVSSYLNNNLESSDILILPIEDCLNFAKINNDKLLTNKEKLEINAISANRRKSEKIAGKVTTKLLANSLLRPALDKPIPLEMIEVLSSDTPVQCVILEPSVTFKKKFSISHSHDLVCVASSDSPIGIDIEKIRTLDTKLVSEICGDSLLIEIENYILNSQLNQSGHGFLSVALPLVIFTQKEAVLKAAGVGVGNGLEGVSIKTISINQAIEISYQNETYSVSTLLSHEYVLSIARKVTKEKHKVLEIGQNRNDYEKKSTDIENPLILDGPEENTEYPLSSIQESALYYSDIFLSDSNMSYTLALNMSIKGPLDITKLKKSLYALISRHSVLRSCFPLVDNVHKITLLNFNEVDFPIHKVEKDNGVELSVNVLQSVVKNSRVLFDVTNGPLFKVNLIEINPEYNVLQIIFDHLIMDCFSAISIGDEIKRDYFKLLNGFDVSNTKVNQYFDFSRREVELLSDVKLKKLSDFWHNKLRDTKPSVLPFPEHKTLINDSNYSNFFDFGISENLVVSFILNTRKTGVTIFAGILSALHCAIMEFLNTDKSLIYIPFSRKNPLLDSGSTGPFVNLLPIKARISGDTTYSDVMQEQRSEIFDSIEYCEIPAKLLVDISLEEMKLNILPPNIICQFIHQVDNSVKQPEYPYFKSVVRDGVNPYTSLIISVFGFNTDFRVSVSFNPTLVDKKTEDKIMNFFIKNFSNIANDSNAIVNSLLEKSDRGTNLLNSQGNKFDSSETYPAQIVYQVIITWQYVLKNIFDINEETNFFDFGGTSLNAVEIVAKLNDIYGIELPLSSFINAPTPKQLAHLIATQNWKKNWDLLVPMQTLGTKPTFYCIHPSDGNVLCYASLAAALNKDYPFYALQAQGLNGIEEPMKSVEAMAEAYIRVIKQHQPNGPYCLGGWSAGGVIAFEMAVQLKLEGEKVHLLLIDSYFPGLDEKNNSVNSDSIIRELLFEENTPLPVGYHQGITLREVWEKASVDYLPKKYYGKISLILSEDFSKRKKLNQENLTTALADRNIIKAQELIAMINEWEKYNPLNWKEVAFGGFDISITAGHHSSMLWAENIPIMAEHLMRFIDQTG